MTNLSRRITELEKTARPDSLPERWKIVGALYEDEPPADVAARWRAAHPDDPPPANFVILVPVDPPADLGGRVP